MAVSILPAITEKSDEEIMGRSRSDMAAVYAMDAVTG